MTASRPEPASVGALLRDAARRFDASESLRLNARRLAPRGFQGGAEWMALGLTEIRGTPLIIPSAGALRAGLIKYGAATAAAAMVLASVGAVSIGAAVPVAVLAFYAVEAQGAFVFPALAAGVQSPWRESRMLVASAGGIVAVVSRTMVIASVMLFGGFAGRGFLRSWCVGCLAMLLWYEELRA